MAWGDLKRMLDGIARVVPADADVTAIAVSADSQLVTIWTSTPGLLIGRRGETADLIKAKLAKVAGRWVELHIKEVSAPPDDPIAGVREPRHPSPSGSHAPAYLPEGADSLPEA